LLTIVNMQHGFQVYLQCTSSGGASEVKEPGQF